MKKEIRADIDFYFNWGFVTIEKLKEDLRELEKLGVTEIEIEPYDDYGDLSVSMNAYTRRLETDEEFRARVDYEIRLKEVVRNNELSELERLKAKYEGEVE